MRKSITMHSQVRIKAVKVKYLIEVDIFLGIVHQRQFIFIFHWLFLPPERNLFVSQMESSSDYTNIDIKTLATIYISTLFFTVLINCYTILCKKTILFQSDSHDMDVITNIQYFERTIDFNAVK